MARYIQENWCFKAKAPEEPPPKPITKLFINIPATFVLLFILGFSNLQGSLESTSNNFWKPVKTQVERSEPIDKEEISFLKGQVIWIASKATRSLNVYRFDGNKWIKKMSFPIIYGSREGNKKSLGDLKTPEGNYWVNNIFMGQSRGPKFGSMVFSLNYPNQEDRKRGKTGGGIWIHGHEIGTDLTSTRGCLKLNNKDLVSLFSVCRGPIPVKILPVEQLMSNPNHLNLSWISEQYPRWKKAFKGTHLTNKRWRNALYQRALSYLDSERNYLYSDS